MPFRIAAIVLLAATLLIRAEPVRADTFEQDVQPLLEMFCFDCHSGDDPSGDVDLSAYHSKEAALSSFETWGKVNELISNRVMPPEDALQPTAQERAIICDWYQSTFVESVEARPGVFLPRRLSATEYRNTLRSLFGFDIELAIMEAEQTITEKSLVMKLLPTDPPGKSRFRNDTYSNPLTVQIWEKYSYLADAALEELFSAERREQLEAIAGEVPASGFGLTQAENAIRSFVPRAWRRDLAEEELDQIVDSLRETKDVVAATKHELKAALMSPSFIYRGLLMPTEAGQQHEVDDFELAERLSYFLWSDMPDEELLRLARVERLSDEGVLRKQVTRMLDSPKAKNLATDFAVQWLALDEIDQVSGNPPVMMAFKSQPIDFFHYLISEDRPLLELIDSEITFANPITRKFYGPDAKQLGRYRKPSGIEFQSVPNQRLVLENTLGRGGLLTMPGVLAMNRGPILRGVWVLERILGEYLPDPPADVGQVEANIPGENLTFRQRFAQHRENESCAVCHDKIDPLGFALEGYDQKGGFLFADNDARKRSTQTTPKERIDTSGRLPTGEEFDDFEGLKSILVTSQRERVTRNIVKQMLAYALCRKLEIYDQPTVESILDDIVAKDGTWRDLIRAIVASLPFRETYVPAESSEDLGAVPRQLPRARASVAGEAATIRRVAAGSRN